MTSHAGHVVSKHWPLGWFFISLKQHITPPKTTETIKAQHYWPFVMWIYRWSMYFPHKVPMLSFFFMMCYLQVVLSLRQMNIRVSLWQLLPGDAIAHGVSIYIYIYIYIYTCVCVLMTGISPVISNFVQNYILDASSVEEMKSACINLRWFVLIAVTSCRNVACILKVASLIYRYLADSGCTFETTWVNILAADNSAPGVTWDPFY